MRHWRQRRRLTQLALATELEISQRHLSFIETGRSQPSREMVLRLVDELALPLRERNEMLVCAGYAPMFPERRLEAPELTPAREVLDSILAAHSPNPALAVDRHWKLISANAAVQLLIAGVAEHLRTGEINVLRLSLHPEGLAPRIVNIGQWREHVLARLAREIELSADPALIELRSELEHYPIPPDRQRDSIHASAVGGFAVPLQMVSEAGLLSFIGTTTVFGTAVDVTLSEITIETFFAVDKATSTALAAMLAGRHD